MKIVKKILIGLAVVFVLIIAAAFILPVVFKDDIKAAIDKEIEKNVNADVVFDVNNFSLSLFRNFPSVTVEIKELGVFNRAPFEGTPLFVIERLEAEVNLKDVLFGDQLRLKGITLVDPQITIKVLADGRANYDITYPSTDTTTVVEEEASSFSFGIELGDLPTMKSKGIDVEPFKMANGIFMFHLGFGFGSKVSNKLPSSPPEEIEEIE